MVDECTNFRMKGQDPTHWEDKEANRKILVSSSKYHGTRKNCKVWTAPRMDLGEAWHLRQPEAHPPADPRLAIWFDNAEVFGDSTDV